MFAALVGPYFIDWTSYRADFEREASRILGRHVTVAGEAKARILPFPSVTFTNVEVAGETADKPSMTVETFSMDAELAPFMRGEFLIFDMRLHRPAITIDVADTGLIDWTIRPNTPFDASEVRLENITVTGGQIAVVHAISGRRTLLDNINATISAGTLAGPWRIKSEFDFDGSPMTATVSTGTVEPDKAMRLRMNIVPGDMAVDIETDGDVSITDRGAVYSGLFRLKEAKQDDRLESDADSAFSISFEDEKSEPVIPFRITGQFSADYRLIDVSEFLFETGNEADPYTAEGSGYLDIGKNPQFSIEMRGQQILFGADRQTEAGAWPLANRIAAFRELMGKVPRPTMPGAVRVNLPAIVAGDTTIRNIKLSAKPNEDGWDIGNFTAELPGRSTLEAKGRLDTGSDFGFYGSMLLAVNQPSGFAAWLSKDVDDAIRHLPAAGFSASVDITARRQAFRDLELILGGARFTGEIDHLSPGNARPSMLLRLDGNALDLDGLAAFTSIFIDDAGMTRFADHNLDFVIKAGPVSAFGLTAASVDTALRLKNGLLDIDRLSIQDLAGSTVSATGKLKNFPGSPNGSLDISVVSVDLQPLVTLLAAHFPQQRFVAALSERAQAYPGLLGDARIDLVGNAVIQESGGLGLALSAHGTSGGSRISLLGSGTVRDGNPVGPLSVKVSLQNDDAAPLFAAFGLPALPLGLTGPTEAKLTFAGETGQLFKTELSILGDDSEASFDGWVGVIDDAWQAVGKAGVRSADIEPWLATAGISVPGYGFGLPVELSADIDHSNKTLKLAQLNGEFDGDPIKASLTADFSKALPALSGTLLVPSIDLVPLAAMLLGEAAFQPGTDGKRSMATPFSPSAMFPFSASLILEAAKLGFGVDYPLEEASLRLVVDDHRLRVSDLRASYRGGMLSGLFDLQNNGGTGLLSTQFTYHDAALSALTATETVGGNATVSADLTANGKSLAGLVSSLSGSGTGVLKDVVIQGVNPDVFDGFIKAADAIGKGISAGDVAEFSGELVASGPYFADEASFAFLVAGGILRTPAIQLDRDNARLETELVANFNTWQATVDGQITYDPGREALVGAAPAIGINAAGPIGGLAVLYDIAPLAQFLTQRALEIEQLRVEALQAGLLEKQRLRREVRYQASLLRKPVDRVDVLDQQQGAAQEEADGIDDGLPAGGEVDGDTLEDEIRRALDEAAKKQADEEANATGGGTEHVAAPLLDDIVIVTPLPDFGVLLRELDP